MSTININKTVEESKFNRFHGLVVFWCALIIIFDGYDLAIYGAVVPVLMEEWSLSSVQAGVLGSYALIGMMAGALVFSPLADKFGRKNIIILCLLLFSVFTGLIVFASSPLEFGVYRFIAGLGLGGAFPITVALMSEYSPKNLKNRLITLMLCGYSIGGIMAAILGIFLIPRFGWQSMFLVGALPLLAIPLIYKYLPDSLGFLLAKDKKKEIGTILSKVDPSYKVKKTDKYDIVVPERSGTISQLFKKGKVLGTFMFWVCFFVCLLLTYGLSTWLPDMMTNAGYALQSSLLFLLVLNVGAMAGAFFGGWMSDIWSTKKVVLTYFLVCAVTLTVMGMQPHAFFMYILVAVAGATTIGTQILLYSFVSEYYPIHFRSTGVGWASGIGRLGGILGPTLGGILFSVSLTFQQNFIAIAIPAVIGAVAVLFIQVKKKSIADTSSVSKKRSVG
ncbi:MFS transporter [Bacillus sp. FJAT-44742]|uniref:MFS transporter n=1 Tax=Bacillus sp. FJAT-44742 TaxID=2014005 RepID=UPI000C23118E|nr:aromatic acid/H+ symport family MFS transporter [Bacillus sp. FJAT-44742]